MTHVTGVHMWQKRCHMWQMRCHRWHWWRWPAYISQKILSKLNFINIHWPDETKLSALFRFLTTIITSFYPLQGRNPGPLYILDDSCSCSTGLNVGLKILVSIRITSEPRNKPNQKWDLLSVCDLQHTWDLVLVQTAQRDTFLDRWLLQQAEGLSALQHTPDMKDD